MKEVSRAAYGCIELEEGISGRLVRGNDIIHAATTSGQGQLVHLWRATRLSAICSF